MTAGILVLSIALVIFGIGFGPWLRSGRTAFAIQEGIPFLVVAIVFLIAGFGLLRLRPWAWWLALLGSLGALAHGIYRYFLSPAIPPWSTSGTPWISSIPGAILTTILGTIILLLLFGVLRPFKRFA